MRIWECDFGHFEEVFSSRGILSVSPCSAGKQPPSCLHFVRSGRRGPVGWCQWWVQRSFSQTHPSALWMEAGWGNAFPCRLAYLTQRCSAASKVPLRSNSALHDDNMPLIISTADVRRPSWKVSQVFRVFQVWDLWSDTVWSVYIWMKDGILIIFINTVYIWASSVLVMVWWRMSASISCID